MLPPHTRAAAARGGSVVLQHQYGSKGDYYSCHCKFKIDCMYRLFSGLGNGMGEDDHLNKIREKLRIK